MGTPKNPLVKVQVKQVKRYMEALTPLESNKEFKILDIGCGDGSYMESLLAELKQRDKRFNLRVYGLDISHAAIAEFNSKNGYRGVIGTAENLPFSEDTFDLILLNDVIEHVVDTDLVMSEIRRVIKNNALCLLSTPNLSAWFNRILLLFGFQPIYSEVSFQKIYGRPGNDVVGHLRLFTHRAATDFINDQHAFNINCLFSRFASLPTLSRFLSWGFCKFTKAGDTMCFSFQIRKF